VSGKQRPDYFPMSNGAFAYRTDDHFENWPQERWDQLNEDRARMGYRPIVPRRDATGKVVTPSEPFQPRG